jgi:hypothetical protein
MKMRNKPGKRAGEQKNSFSSPFNQTEQQRYPFVTMPLFVALSQRRNMDKTGGGRGGISSRGSIKILEQGQGFARSLPLSNAGTGKVHSCLRQSAQ